MSFILAVNKDRTAVLRGVDQGRARLVAHNAQAKLIGVRFGGYTAWINRMIGGQYSRARILVWQYTAHRKLSDGSEEFTVADVFGELELFLRDERRENND